MSVLTSNFGTVRGLIRLALSYGEVATGQAGVVAPDVSTVRRLVFVCHGNICRSAFAEAVARNAGLASASFGLSTDAGKPADRVATTVAATLGRDMRAHRTTRAHDFLPEPGDFLLAMETRQLRRLARDPQFASVPRSLLGLYATPVVPHLHDPYELSVEYMATCLRRIERAVINLGRLMPAARLS